MSVSDHSKKEATKLVSSLLNVVSEDDDQAMHKVLEKFGAQYISSLRDKHGKNVLMLSVEASARGCVSELLATPFASQLCKDVDNEGHTCLHIAYGMDARAKLGMLDHAMNPRIVPMIEAYSLDVVGRQSVYAKVVKETVHKETTLRHTEWWHSMFSGGHSNHQSRENRARYDEAKEKLEDRRAGNALAPSDAVTEASPHEETGGDHTRHNKLARRHADKHHHPDKHHHHEHHDAAADADDASPRQARPATTPEDPKFQAMLDNFVRRTDQSFDEEGDDDAVERLAASERWRRAWLNRFFLFCNCSDNSVEADHAVHKQAAFDSMRASPPQDFESTEGTPRGTPGRRRSRKKSLRGVKPRPLPSSGASFASRSSREIDDIEEEQDDHPSEPPTSAREVYQGIFGFSAESSAYQNWFGTVETVPLETDGDDGHPRHHSTNKDPATPRSTNNNGRTRRRGEPRRKKITSDSKL